MTTQASSSTPIASRTPSTTLIDHVNALLTSHAALTTALPYLHPYAPSSAQGKGKGKATAPVDAPAEILKGLKKTIDGAREVFQNRTWRADDRVKLVRALKDVSTQRQSLNPSSIASLRPSPTTFPSRLTLLSPVDLLRALSTDMGIQFYNEESQFGLLKTSLTLAGSCFVVDLDLETDSPGGNDEDDDMDEARSEGTGQEREGKGKMRLSKISSSHARGEVTAKSEWIARVVKELVEEYLSVWNDGERSWARQVKLEEAIRRLETELRVLKELDEVAEGVGEGGVDWFAELDTVVQKLRSVNIDALATIHPSFRLFPSSPKSPTFRLRPLEAGEIVQTPAGLSRDDENQWLAGAWVLEYVKSSAVDDGLVVRQTWLAANAADGETNWDGLYRVEHLLYRQVSPENSGLAFPYTTDFVHPSGKGELEQRWAMAVPGPEAFVIGRIGLPKSFEGLQKLIERCQAQSILNDLFASVFHPDNADKSSEGESEVDLEELSLPPRAVPITVSLHQRSVQVTFPLKAEDDVTLTLAISPAARPPFVEIQWDAPVPLTDVLSAKVEEGVKVARAESADAVAIVRRVLEYARG